MAAAWGVPGETTERFTMRPYKPVYLLAFNYNSRMNDLPGSPTQPASPEQGLKRTEVKYQLSFKTRIASGLFGDNGDVWAAYTQSSHWQLYSPAISRPFRETNYEPEAVFVWKTRAELLGATLRYAGIGINHQSNGRSDPLSRSWNRVIAQAGFERGDWGATVRVWRRIEESGSDDDNPDIEDFMGRGELLLTRHAGEHLLAVTLRPPTSPHRQGNGALQADWSFPLSGRLKGHLQYFVGRGESLIDYNHFARTLGIGVSLVAWR
jgi:phospholipase A1/A2